MDFEPVGTRHAPGGWDRKHEDHIRARVERPIEPTRNDRSTAGTDGRWSRALWNGRDWLPRPTKK